MPLLPVGPVAPGEPIGPAGPEAPVGPVGPIPPVPPEPPFCFKKSIAPWTFEEPVGGVTSASLYPRSEANVARVTFGIPGATATAVDLTRIAGDAPFETIAFCAMKAPAVQEMRPPPAPPVLSTTGWILSPIPQLRLMLGAPDAPSCVIIAALVEVTPRLLKLNPQLLPLGTVNTALELFDCTNRFTNENDPRIPDRASLAPSSNTKNSPAAPRKSIVPLVKVHVPFGTCGDWMAPTPTTAIVIGPTIDAAAVTSALHDVKTFGPAIPPGL